MAEFVQLTIRYPAEYQQLIYDAFADAQGWQERVPSDDVEADGYDAETRTVPNPKTIADVVHESIVGYVMTVAKSYQVKTARKAAEEAAIADAEQKIADAVTRTTVETATITEP